MSDNVQDDVENDATGSGPEDSPDGAPEAGSPQDPSTPQDPLAAINDDDLANYILQLLRNDTNDKEQFGWTSDRQYDINSYEGNMKPTNFPWVNACNFPVPLTPTLVDTAHSNILGSIFADQENTVDVQGVGQEDIRLAPQLAQLLNWQLNVEIDTYEKWDIAVFWSLLHGTTFLKVIQSMQEGKVLLSNVPAENIYLPIDAQGMQVTQTDHVIEVIALTRNDIEERRNLIDSRTGKPVYEGIEEIGPGLRIANGSTIDSLAKLRDSIAGTKLSDRQTRDLYYLLEVYLTYYPNQTDKTQTADPIELVVTLAPNGKRILRKEINKSKLRPYVPIVPYPFPDRFFGQSLPVRVRPIQEELNYSHNQNINAADRAIAPPLFYDPNSGFDPQENQIVPGGCYPATKTPETVQIQVNPIFERQEDRYWDLAERRTGLTELFQGRAPGKTKTLGEAKLRNNRTEIRFKTLYQRYEKAWAEMLRLIYFYDSVWMPKDKKIKVLGVNDFKTIQELFPEGMDGQYNFTFRNAPITEIELKKQMTVEMSEFFLTQPLVQMDKGNTWRVMQRYAEAKGERNLETIVSKPDEAYLFGPEEAIQRIMSGDYDVMPNPGINAIAFEMRIMLFLRTDTFKNSKPEAKQAFMKLLHVVQQYKIGQMRAKVDAHIIKRGPVQPGMDQNGNGQMQPQGQEAA